MTEPRSTHPEFCHYTFSDNRQCRVLRQETHPTLCPFRARDEQQLLESHTLGAQIAATYTADYLTAADINHVLSRVFTALAQNRIPQRTAVTMAYLGQIMLQTLPLVKKEHPFVYSHETWNNMIDNATHLSAPPAISYPTNPNRIRDRRVTRHAYPSVMPSGKRPKRRNL